MTADRAPAFLPTVRFSGAPQPADAVVLPVTTVDGELAIAGPLAQGALDGGLTGEVLAAIGASSRAGDVCVIPSRDLPAPIAVLAGVDGPRCTQENLRRAAGAAARKAPGPHLLVAFPADDLAPSYATAEGAALGAYWFDRYRTDVNDDRASRAEQITVLVPSGIEAAAAEQEARIDVLAQAVHATRDLVNAAPNDLYPQAFAELARAAAAGVPHVKVTVLNERELAERGCGGLTSVGQGSIHPPRLVTVAYRPDGATGPAVGLIGKGITFDSGGISLKPPAGMADMKSDMAGAATVLHAVLAAARLRVPVAVTAYLCLAENLPSGSAARPSDVITMADGTTVEILNTDAEGRLVMADGLCVARHDGAGILVDIATLTGAQVVALGSLVAGVMGQGGADGAILAAAQTQGELAWGMPLPDELRPNLRSQVADIANVSSNREAGMLTAGLFLQKFADDVPWAHIDAAGPAYNTGEPHGYTPRGGTGYGVRTLVAFLEQLANGDIEAGA